MELLLEGSPVRLRGREAAGVESFLRSLGEHPCSASALFPFGALSAGQGVQDAAPAVGWSTVCHLSFTLCSMGGDPAGLWGWELPLMGALSAGRTQPQPRLQPQRDGAML